MKNEAILRSEFDVEFLKIRKFLKENHPYFKNYIIFYNLDEDISDRITLSDGKSGFFFKCGKEEDKSLIIGISYQVHDSNKIFDSVVLFGFAHRDRNVEFQMLASRELENNPSKIRNILIRASKIASCPIKLHNQMESLGLRWRFGMQSNFFRFHVKRK